MGRLPLLKQKKESKATKGFLVSLGNALRKCYDEPLALLLVGKMGSGAHARATPLERAQNIKSAIAYLKKYGHPDPGLIGKILRLVSLGKRDSKVLAKLLIWRSNLTQQIGCYKIEHKFSIYRPEVEQERIDYLVKYAKKHGCTDSVVIETIFRTIIISSRKRQEEMLEHSIFKFEKVIKKAKKISPKRKASKTSKK